MAAIRNTILSPLDLVPFSCLIFRVMTLILLDNSYSNKSECRCHHNGVSWCFSVLPHLDCSARGRLLLAEDGPGLPSFVLTPSAGSPGKLWFRLGM